MTLLIFNVHEVMGQTQNKEVFKSIKVSLLQILEKERRKEKKPRKKANKKHWKLQGRRKRHQRAARAGNLVSQESQKHAEQSGDGPFKES